MQGGEEGVEFGQVGALAGFLLLDGLDDGGEAVLEVQPGGTITSTECDSAFTVDRVKCRPVFLTICASVEQFALHPSKSKLIA